MEPRDAAAEARENRNERGPSTDRLWSPGTVGGLFVAAAVISPAVHALSGDWPAGYGGRVAAAFAFAGVGLLTYSFAVES